MGLKSCFFIQNKSLQYQVTNNITVCNLFCLIFVCNLGFLGLQVRITKPCDCYGRYALKEIRRVWSCLAIACFIPHAFYVSLLLIDYTVLTARHGTYVTHK